MLQRLWLRCSKHPQDVLSSLVVHSLATWRISHILVYEYGPWAIFEKLRIKVGIEHDADGVPTVLPDGVVLTCLMCTSVWVAAALILVPYSVKMVFAASAIACIIEARNG